jgi:hypothetical protein
MSVNRDYISEIKDLDFSLDIQEIENIIRAISCDKQWIKLQISGLLSEIFDQDSKVYKSIGAGTSLVLGNKEGALKDKEFLLAISHHKPIPTTSFVNPVISSIISPVTNLIEIDEYYLPAEWDCEVFDPKVVALFSRKITLYPGDVFTIIPGKNCYDFKFSKETAIIKAQLKQTLQKFEWSFDASSGEAFQSIAIHASDTYAQYLCFAARSIKSEKFLPQLRKLLDYPAYSVRWAAAQAIGKIELGEGIRALQYLTKDPNALISSAAIRALAQVH